MKPLLRPWTSAAIGLLLGALAGCVATGTTPVRMSEAEVSIDEAVASAIDAVFAPGQAQSKLPGFLAKIESKIAPAGKRVVMAEPVLEAGTGYQTAATQAIDARIAERVAAHFADVELLPFQGANVARAQFLLTGTMARTGAPGAAGGGWRIDLALAEVKTRSIAAQATARARAQGVDTTPTGYYRDTPVVLRDGVVEQSEAVSRLPGGQVTPEGYLERLPAATLLADATGAYNAERFEQALGLYEQALGAVGGEQIRVHNGIYLANWRLGRAAEAEAAFGRVVALGLSNRSLGVKFLFKTNSTEFWPDPKVSSPYEFWLRQIARQATAGRACLHVVGHTSRTGGEQYNDQLSQRRAQAIKQRLETESADLGARVRFSGKGYRENLVGTGTDDMRDALDRRVEFKVDPC